ncbi:MAG: hypothetical protein AAF716_17015 [Cyanobacteria bacterium P01_D01_bin.1]
MLKSYEAIYENGKVKWLNEQPTLSSARIIVTVLDDLLPDSWSPSPSAQSVRQFGQFRGQIQIADDFDAALPDEFWLGES